MLRWMRAQVARWRATLTPVLNLLLFAIAIWVVNRVLAEYKYDEIAGALTAVPVGAVTFALVVTVAAYLRWWGTTTSPSATPAGPCPSGPC